jgi:hypothetical protein
MKKTLSGTGLTAFAVLALTGACAVSADEQLQTPKGIGGQGNQAGVGGQGAAGVGAQAGIGGANAGNAGTFGFGGSSSGSGGSIGGGGGMDGNAGAGGGGGLAGGGPGGTDGAGGSGVGGSGVGGTDGVGGSGVGGSGVGGSGVGGTSGGGACCPDGNCICRGEPPSNLTFKNGPYQSTTTRGTTGTIYYPTNADPPFAGVAVCGGFLNTGPEMNGWGSFYASWGIVTIITTTGGGDFPDVRARKLLASIDELKAASGPLSGKMAGRFGTSGYSMGGGGTTIATTSRPELKTSVGLAPWGPVGAGVRVPTLLECATGDLVAPCGTGAQAAYGQIPNTTQKMLITISGGDHLLTWFGPRDGGGGVSGMYALAFQKVFLEGDTRWKSLLVTKPGTHAQTTNIQ